MRVLMTGGGTGGHINPALAICRIIKEREPDSEIMFVGTPNGMENELVTREGYPIKHVRIKGIRRGTILGNLKTARLMLSSKKEAGKIIREFSPDVCIGTGGFVSWPLISAAESLGVPTVLHESNCQPGMAVKALAPKLSLLFTNFEETAELVKCRNVIRSGNPMRKGIAKTGQREAMLGLGLGEYSYSVLSCGGSNGAEAISNEMIPTMKLFSSRHPEVFHLHQTGKRKFEDVKKRFDDEGLSSFPNLEIRDYIYDMPQRLCAADVVISRAGAMTLSELAELGKPAILIPSPNVADNHQYRNAKSLSDRGAAVLVEESELDGKKIASILETLVFDEDRKKSMSEAISGFAVKDTDKIIYDGIRSVIR